MFMHSDSGYMNQELFLEWLEKVFVVAVKARRADLDLPENKQAFLIMDNCPAHTDREVEAVLGRHHIKPVFIPPHGSHIFQPLDRVCFASFKAHLRSAIPEDTVDKQTMNFLKVLQSWEDANIDGDPTGERRARRTRLTMESSV